TSLMRPRKLVRRKSKSSPARGAAHSRNESYAFLIGRILKPGTTGWKRTVKTPGACSYTSSTEWLVVGRAGVRGREDCPTCEHWCHDGGHHWIAVQDAGSSCLSSTLTMPVRTGLL